MRDNVVLRLMSRLLVPPILLFALYVQFHGDYGPGGGFQAGVIFAAGLILYAIVAGPGAGRRVLPPWLLRWCIATGVLLYLGTGLICMLLGGAFLDYNVLAGLPTEGQHLGILLVEGGVGLAVAGVMLTIYFCFAEDD